MNRKAICKEFLLWCPVDEKGEPYWGYISEDKKDALEEALHGMGYTINEFHAMGFEIRRVKVEVAP
jgi:hypothetical protein